MGFQVGDVVTYDYYNGENYQIAKEDEDFYVLKKLNKKDFHLLFHSKKDGAELFKITNQPGEYGTV